MKFFGRKPAAIFAAAALALSGCGGGGSTRDEGDLSGTLVFANWQWLEPGRGDAIWEAVSAYSKANPEATIERQEITRATYDKMISTELGAGGGPDVFIASTSLLPSLAESGALEPLNGVLSPESEAALRLANKDFDYDGEQLALLWESVPYALIWNKKLTDAAGVGAPADFAELVANARAVKEATGKTGFVVRHQLNEETAWWQDYASWPFGFGGHFSKDGELTLDDPKNIEALEAFKEIYDSGAFGIGDDASTYRSKFGAGEVGYVIDNSSAVFAMLAASSLTPDDIGSSVLPFPAGSSARTGPTIVVNPNSENIALAKDFIRWVFSAEGQDLLADALFPSAIATNQTAAPELIDANPWIQPFYQQLDNSNGLLIEGFETETPQIAHIIMTQVQRVLVDQATPTEAMEQAQKEAQSLR